MSTTLSEDDRSRASTLRWLLSVGLAGAWIAGWSIPLVRQHEAELATLPKCPAGSAAESGFLDIINQRPHTCADNVAPLKKPIDEQYGNRMLLVVLTSPIFFILGRFIADDKARRDRTRFEREKAQAYSQQRRQEYDDEAEREANMRSALEDFDSNNRSENIRADIMTRLGLIVEDIDILTDLSPSDTSDIQHQKEKINLHLSKMVSHDRTEEVIAFSSMNTVARGRLAHIQQRLQRLAMDNVDLSILMTQIKKTTKHRWWR